MIDFGASGRLAGASLLALAVGMTTAATATAKDIPGRKRCFVAGIETYKEEPVYRDKSSGFQRVQVPGSKGERCFWEPLDYQAAAAAAPVRPSRAAPAIEGRHAREAESNVAESRFSSASERQIASAPSAVNEAAPRGREPQRLAALPPERSPRYEPAPQAEPEPAPPPEPAPQFQPEPTPPPRSEPVPEIRSEPAPRPRSEPAPRPRSEPAPRPRSEPAPPPHRPAMPVLSPKGMSSGGSAASQDLRIETRPVTSGGALSTVSSGPGIEALTRKDQVIPSAGEPMRLAAAQNALASLSPRTTVRRSRPTSETREDEPSAPPPAAERGPGPVTSSRASPETAKPARRTASSSEGGSFVQLGSVPSYQKAKQFWTDVTGRYPEALKGFSPDILKADIPGKGTWYRVRVGPFDRSEAKALCERLDGKCLVVAQ